MVIIRSYTNFKRYRKNKIRAIKTGTFENCWTVIKDSKKFWVLMEVKI
jgi:hypothetical protein